MSHIDCDTIPFFWQYASRFTLFDNIFATEDTPSTPNAIAMIAGQSGETQWVKHGTEPRRNAAHRGTINGKTYSGTGTTQGRRSSTIRSRTGARSSTRPPADRAAGRAARRATRSATSPSNLTFATVPLTSMGSAIAERTRRRIAMPRVDLADIQQDIPYIQSPQPARR